MPVSIAARSFLASAGESTGVAPLVTTCFGPRTAAAGFHREDLVDDEPVAEHANRGQVLLHPWGPDPGQPGFLELGDQEGPSLLLAAERAPLSVLLELLQELRPGQGPLVAGHLGPEGLHERGGADLGDAEEPFDVAPGEELPVELLELADGVGDGEQPPGLRGHRAGPQRQTENGPPGGGVNGFARATSARMSTRRPTRLWPRLAGCVSGSTSAPAAVPGRLEASVSRPAAGAAAASPTATTPASRRRRPKVAASASTSAAGPPDPPGAAAAAAGVPGGGRRFPEAPASRPSETRVCPSSERRARRRRIPCRSGSTCCRC